MDVTKLYKRSSCHPLAQNSLLYKAGLATVLECTKLHSWVVTISVKTSENGGKQTSIGIDFVRCRNKDIKLICTYAHLVLKLRGNYKNH